MKHSPKTRRRKLLRVDLSPRRVVFSGVIGLALMGVLMWSGFGLLLSPLLGLVAALANLLEIDLPGRWNTWLGRFLWALTPILSLWMVEVLNYNTLFTEVTPLQILLNLVWYYLIFAILFLITGRRNTSARWGAILCFTLGTANHYLIHFRGRAIFPVDLLTLRTAANVAGSYDYAPCETHALVLLGLVLLVTVIGWLPREKTRASLRWPVIASGAAAWGIYIVLFFASPMVETLGIEPSLWTTVGNGFFLNFTVCMKYSTVEKPEGYSLSAAQTIAAEVENVTNTGGVIPENIIVIMDEAFSDLSSAGPLETSDEPMPFISSLTEDTIKGTAYVSVFGGTTANSEYEFLTGNTMAFLPAGSVPYQLFVREGDTSLVGQLEEAGYTTVALHPYLRSGWNRPQVYSAFGFDKVLFQSDMVNTETVRDYISDLSSFKEIIRLYEEKPEGEEFFLFNVTMQNHSNYNQEWTNLERTVELAGNLAGTSAWANQYLSLVRESDEAFQYLVEYFEQVDEPTLILFFGDHQPQLGTTFYSNLMGKDVNSLTPEENLTRHETVFVLWANYDIPEAADVDLSLNYLSTLLLQQTGLELTGYQSFLSGLMADVPVICAAGFVTADGTYAEHYEDLPAPLAERVNEYAILQYNGMDEPVSSFF